ncbi:DUF6414 family protein [Gryllotalpicola kribbensis]|uniref:DUF6414 family protein n=1 Tax=Gryllotalpicola kribbensis TaxID=993084 RepID=UPI0031D8E34B
MRKIDRLRRFTDPLGNIRQFLYLDSIALRSLYISRYGPEDARMTITRSQTRDAEINGGFDYSIPALGSATAGAKLRSSTSQSIQVERVASEQSLFRDFLDRERAFGKGSLLWQGAPDEHGVFTHAERPLQRGDLIEVRIRLEADRAFRFGSFASTTGSLAEGTSMFSFPGARQFVEVGDLLRQLLIEQAPIDSELVDWGWDAKQKLITRASEATEPLRLVALTQVDNYWIDVRRALFDRAECTALVRVSQDVPTTGWTPVKLFDAVRDLPGLESMSAAIDMITAGFDPVANQTSAIQPQLYDALRRYAAAISSPERAVELDEQISLIATAMAPMLPSASSVVQAFNEVDQLFDTENVPSPDPDVRAEGRDQALAEAQLDQNGNSRQVRVVPTRTEKQYLVGERDCRFNGV